MAEACRLEEYCDTKALAAPQKEASAERASLE
jgi:hypothetical protein